MTFVEELADRLAEAVLAELTVRLAARLRADQVEADRIEEMVTETRAAVELALEPNP